MFNRAILCGILAGFLAGCAGTWQGITALRGYSSSQTEIARQIKVQENRFRILVLDIEKNRIKTGLEYRAILRRYGEPVLIWNTEAPALTSKKLLYRKPVDYFYTDRVYLYFDAFDRLVKWEYYPALKEIKEDSNVQKSN